MCPNHLKQCCTSFSSAGVTHSLSHMSSSGHNHFLCYHKSIVACASKLGTMDCLLFHNEHTREKRNCIDIMLTQTDLAYVHPNHPLPSVEFLQSFQLPSHLRYLMWMMWLDLYGFQIVLKIHQSGIFLNGHLDACLKESGRCQFNK
jgi:hypothetical protein